MSTSGRVLKLLVGLIVGGVCLVLAFQGVASPEAETGMGWTGVWAALRATSSSSLLAVGALSVAQFVVRSERWRIQVGGLTGRTPPWREGLAINAVAFSAVFLLPFRLGEFVRPNLCAQRGIMRVSEGLASTALERVIDGIVTTGMFGVVLLVAERRGMALPGYVRVGGATALVVFGGALLVFVAAFRWREQTTRWFEAVFSRVHPRLARRLADTLRGFLGGLACFRRRRDLVAYLACTIAYWLLNVATTYALMEGMGLGVDLLAAFLCVCFLIIGVMIPAPPGNVGTFHAFARVALTVCGVAPLPAVAFAVALHALMVVGQLGWTALFFVTGDLSLAGVRAAATQGDAGVAAEQGKPG